MIFAKKYTILIFTFFSVFNLFSQASLTVSDYGAFFIDNGNTKKIPTTEYLIAPIFWRNYISFYGAEGGFALLYNIENGATSDLLYPDNKGGCFPLESSNKNLLFYFGGFAYELDPVTLKTLNKSICTDYLRASDWDVYEQDVRRSRISEHIDRYDGDNFYLIVTLNENINPLRDINVRGGKKNQFVFIINDIDVGK